MRTLLGKLVTGGMIALSSLLPLKKSDAQTHFPSNENKIEFTAKIPKQFINPFIQPNDSTLNWYGSGYGNYKDVNGDEIINDTDNQILEDYENSIIDYLPGHWNKLKTKQERENWLNKMLAIDKTDTLKWIEGEWVSGNFAIQTHINLHGFKGEIPSKYNKTNNCKFNIPVYSVRVSNSSNESYPFHGMNAILIGDSLNGDPRIWKNWYFIEPQNDGKVKIGDGSIDKNSEVWIGKVNILFNDAVGTQSIVKFSIKDSIPSLLSFDEEYVPIGRDIPVSVEDRAERKTIPTNFYLEQNFPNPFNSSTTIKYNLPHSSNVSLKVYNLLGQELETLVNAKQIPGEHAVRWDASKYTPGVYFYKLQTGKDVKTKKMVFVK